MNTDMKLGARLSNVLKEREIDQQTAANASGTHRVSLSRYLRDERIFELDVLDALTRYLGYPAGHFYPYYDCWVSEERQVRELHKRAREFTIRCERLGLQTLVERNIEQIVKIEGYEVLFEIGKTLQAEGRVREALVYFDLVITHEQDRRSPVLAESYYRRFLIVREFDLEEAWTTAIKLADYVQNIEGHMQYEAYIKLINLLYVLDRWEHLERYSNELAHLLANTEGHISETLYGDALVNLGFAYRKRREFAKCLETINQYAKIPTGKYRLWAEGNKMILEIAQGNVDRVYSLCEYVKRNPAEAPANVDIILETFVTHDKLQETEAFLRDFHEEINHLYGLSNPLNSKRIIRFRYYKALYLLKTKQRGWVDEIIAAITIAHKLRFDVLRNWCYELVLRHLPALDAEGKQRLADMAREM